MRRLSALVLLVLAAPLAAAQRPLTISEIFSTPPVDGVLPKEVHWLPDGRSFSYLATENGAEKGATVLWREDAATGERTAVLESATLEPFAAGGRTVKPSLAGYRWAPDGRSVLLEGDGELFLADAASGAVRRLTDTAAEEELARFSPDGKRVAFVRDNDLWVIELAGGAERRLTFDGGPDHFNGKLDWVYEEELAGRDPMGYAWSPDSRAIVYITLDETKVPRFPLTDLMPVHPHTTMELYPAPGDPNPVPGLGVVGVVPGPDGAAVRRLIGWDSPDVEYLPRFGWLPGSEGVWYEVMNRAQTRLELARMDLSGRTSPLLVETDPAWINLDDDLHFLRDGRFLFSSERDGWRHLYLHAADGRPIRQLTSGAWQVTGVDAVDEASGWVVFTATKASPLERRVYRVRLAGGAVEDLTPQAGTHQARVSPDGALFLDTCSTVTSPPEMRVAKADGGLVRKVAYVVPPRLGDFALGTSRFVEVAGPGGQTLRGQLLLPAGFDPAKRYPVVVYVYGGPHAQVVRDVWGGRNELFHNVLAGRGMLVFYLDNRGSFGRGKAFETALLRRLGRTELEDQLAGVAYLKSLPYVDGSRIGMWGWSYGGFMTCYALTNAPDTFAAGAAVAPVTNWRLYDSIYTERYLKLPADNEAGYRDSSPVNQAASLEAPLLLIHGTGDDNVHWQNTLQFTDRLYQAGKSYDLHLYANKRHSISGREARITLYSRIADHFARYLGARGAGDAAAGGGVGGGAR